MTRNEAVSLIESRLGNRSGLSTRIISEMILRQSTEWERNAVLPWFLLKPLSLVVNSTQSVQVPSDFIREYEEGEIWISKVGEDLRFRLCKDLYARLMWRSIENDKTGQPDSYALVGNTFYLFPKPQDLYIINGFYYAADQPLTGDIENNWLKYAPDFCIADVGLLIARHLRDENGVRFFSDDLERARKRLFVDDEARKNAAICSFMGG